MMALHNLSGVKMDVTIKCFAVFYVLTRGHLKLWPVSAGYQVTVYLIMPDVARPT